MPDQSTMSASDLAAQALASVGQQSDETEVSTMTSPASHSSDMAQSLGALQQVIERNALALDEAGEKLRELRESLKNVFDNDTQLSIVQQDVERVGQELKNRRTQLQSGPQVMQLKAKISELSEQKKEIEEALNNHLLNLYKITGTKVVDLTSGEREFTVKASLKSARKV